MIYIIDKRSPHINNGRVYWYTEPGQIAFLQDAVFARYVANKMIYAVNYHNDGYWLVLE